MGSCRPSSPDRPPSSAEHATEWHPSRMSLRPNRARGRVGTRWRAGAAALGLSLTLSASAAVALSGCTLGGTAGLPDMAPDQSTEGLEAFPPAPAGLPEQIYLRTTTETFNRRWSFIARDGRVFTKEAAARGGWREVTVPAPLAGRVAGVSADGDEVMMGDRDGRFHTMDHALNAPRHWNWTDRFGPLLWLGPGNRLPPSTIAWSWSVISPTEDRVWRDTAGNDHLVGSQKVSHVFSLTDGGQRIRFQDPWLPIDHAYEMATPYDGRFRAVALSTSASSTLITNRYGDMYTRLYDFDISGSDVLFFRYSYEDQSELPEAPDLLSARFDSRYAAIQLPAPGWVQQPKVPGEITDRISIHRTGIGSAARELRVEGRNRGRTGYWMKALEARSWTFVRTGQPLSGTVLENSRADRSAETLGPLSPYSYLADSGRGWRAAIDRFDVAVTPTRLTIDFDSGAELTLTLHTVDGLRQSPQLPGISDQPRVMYGTIEAPIDLLDHLPSQPVEVQDFVTNHLGAKRFTPSAVEVSASGLGIERLHLELARV